MATEEDDGKEPRLEERSGEEDVDSTELDMGPFMLTQPITSNPWMDPIHGWIQSMSNSGTAGYK